MSSGRNGILVMALVALLNLSATATAADLVETRPVMPPDKFSGKAAEAYKLAAELPGVMDAQYCYCKCKENQSLKHKTLLTCFTSDHASKCEICIREAEISAEMTRHGKSQDEIRVAIDQYGNAKLKEAAEKAAAAPPHESDAEHHHHH